LIANKATMPVLIVAGTEDKVSPIAINADPLAKSLKNAKLEILQGIGHLPHLEAPQRVNEFIREYFGEARPSVANKFQLTGYQLSVYKTIDSLIQYQENMTMAKDTNAMKLFYPEDMVITNPFGQLIYKKTMIERVKTGVINYTKFEKTIEHFAMEGTTVAIVAGKEKVTPSTTANRKDAGKPHERRFTECWVLRNGQWQRLVRHASNL
jgi:hypothetical protein